MGRFAPAFVAAVGVIAIALAATAEGAGSPAEGHRLALKICAFCHVVAADQEFAPILRKRTPSFRAIANARGMTAESLKKFILTTHSSVAEPANMPNPQLTDDQANDIVSYILSLRRSGEHR